MVAAMADDIFAHPRLAEVYDAFDGLRDDLAAYLAIAAELGATRVLDVGCGTGSLAALLADHGYTVVGIDPAEASLAVARRKDPRVDWRHGDAATLPHVDADLAVMTGNVAQVFVSDEQWSAALRGIHAALRPGGRLVFETRRPGDRAWVGWAADTASRSMQIPGIGEVAQRREVTEVRLPLVSFRYTYKFVDDGVELGSDSTLRFRDRAEVEADLAAHGFRVLDVRDAPDRPGREYVFLAERTD